jgi:hypothetical protein
VHDSLGVLAHDDHDGRLLLSLSPLCARDVIFSAYLRQVLYLEIPKIVLAYYS